MTPEERQKWQNFAEKADELKRMIDNQTKPPQKPIGCIVLIGLIISTLLIFV